MSAFVCVYRTTVCVYRNMYVCVWCDARNRCHENECVCMSSFAATEREFRPLPFRVHSSNAVLWFIFLAPPSLHTHTLFRLSISLSNHLTIWLTFASSFHRRISNEKSVHFDEKLDVVSVRSNHGSLKCKTNKRIKFMRRNSVHRPSISRAKKGFVSNIRRQMWRLRIGVSGWAPLVSSVSSR